MWELDHKQGWVLKNWCFQSVVFQKTLESPLGYKIKLLNPKGNQPWIFFERTDDEAETPTLWPPVDRTWLIGKDPDSGKDWRQEEKWMTEDEMVRWQHWFNGHEFEQTPGDGTTNSMDVSLSKIQEIVKDREACCAVVHGAAKSWTGPSDWSDLIWNIYPS